MNKSIIIIVLVILSSSCRKEIDIKIPDSDRKIVLNALVHPDSLFYANVFRSNHIQDNLTQLLYLNNATVEVMENGNLLETLALDTLGYYKGNVSRAEEGHVYEYVVWAPNLQTVTAKTETVNKVSIISIDSIETITYDSDPSDPYVVDVYSGDHRVYRVRFHDNVNEENFYRIKVDQVQRQSDDNYYYSSGVESTDPSIEVWSWWDGYYYFSDKLFNGKEYGFELLIQVPPDIQNQYLSVYLEHVSSDFYRYVFSVDFQNETKGGELFFQTVQVLNNIENGYGIIGNTSVAVDSILLR